MTARFYVKCPSCGKVTLIRFQMGYLEYHPIRISCGCCKATMSGQFKNGGIDFGKYELVDNMHADYVIQSSGELLTHALKLITCETDTMSPSPFINSCMLIRKEKFETFRKRFSYVINYKKNMFQTIRTINEHYFNNNTDLLIEQIHNVLPVKQFPTSNKLEILRSVHMINNMFFMNVAETEFSGFTTEFFDIQQRISRKCCQQLFCISTFFESMDLFSKWEKRIFQLSSLIIENLEKFMPVIWFDLYDLSLEAIENEYAITTVLFEEIESIYLKCYELLSEMLPLIIAFDNALIRNDYNILKSPHAMNDKATTLNDYIRIVPKGTKIQYMDGREPLEHIVCDVFDKGIRNSIGHFDYEYEMNDPFKQTYKFYDIKNRNQFKTRSLLGLCHETWKMYLAVFKLAEILYHTQKIDLTGKGYHLDVTIDDIHSWRQ